MKFVDSQEDMFLKMCKLHAAELDIPLLDPRARELYGPSMYTLIQEIPAMSDSALTERLLGLTGEQRLVLWVLMQQYAVPTAKEYATWRRFQALASQLIVEAVHDRGEAQRRERAWKLRKFFLEHVTGSWLEKFEGFAKAFPDEAKAFDLDSFIMGFAR